MGQWRFLADVLVFLIILINIEFSASFQCIAKYKRFQCPGESACLTEEQVCDFKIDCKSGADEQNCTLPTCHPSDDFTCHNGKCIYNTWTCDGNDDCFDNSDEDPEYCAKKKCSAVEFKCGDSGECVPIGYRCDGDEDCDGGEDEFDCPPPNCTLDEKLCEDKRQCVSLLYICDGEEDCDDGSDEKHCNGIICGDDQFECADGNRCIVETAHCDGMNDCADGSDEKDCTEDETKHCVEGFFSCRSSKLCFPESYRCNGAFDCRDRSDELNCDFFKDTCPVGDKLCANRRQCINKVKWCDGNRDCIDSSDEKECEEKRPVTNCPHETHFLCKSGQCIAEHRVCDNWADCSGKDDEPSVCRLNECAIANGNCSHGCLDSKIGYVCTCPTGYGLDSDKLSCKDIDECKSIDNTCEARCINEPGTFRCLGHGPSPNFIVGDRNRIVNLSLELSQTAHPIIGKIYVHSVAVDVKRDIVYWTDPRAEKIFKTNLQSPSSSMEGIIVGNLVEDPTSLALDWVHNLLFWVDSSYSSVSVAALGDILRIKTLIKSKNVEILSIAVYPKYGYLYVGYETPPDGDTGKLERCGMDGQGCEVIVSEKIELPVDIAIDYEQDILYWIDEQLRILAISQLDGSGRRNVLMDMHSMNSLAVFSGRVYMTDMLTRRILSTNRKGEDLKSFKKGLSMEADLAIYNSEAQKEGTDQCSSSLCGGICLPSMSSTPYNGYTCVCPDGYVKSDSDSNICKSMTSTQSTSESISVTPSKTTNEGQKTSKSPGNPTTMNSISETNVPSNAGTNSKAILIIGIIAVLVIIVCTLFFVMRFRRQRSARMSMNFNNPIYKKMENGTSTRDPIPGLTEPSPSTSSGDVSNHSNEGTAALVLYEEIPDSGKPQMVSGARFVNNGRYTTVPSNDPEVDFAGETR